LRVPVSSSAIRIFADCVFVVCVLIEFCKEATRVLRRALNRKSLIWNAD